jgi:DNA repair protein RecN (Recombination protein N)
LIEEIYIRDLGIISEAKLEFTPGLTAITGETGAGKTMVLSGLGLLLGARADSSAVHSGASQALVEGRWLLPRELAEGKVGALVADAGAELDGGELIVNRSVTADRSRAAVGGRAVGAGLLAELAEHLVVVHGQADQLRLKSASAQREALDEFAGAEEADRLRFAVEELEQADPQPGELDELTAKAERLTHQETLRAAASQAHDTISSDGSDSGPDAITAIGIARRALESAANYDEKLGEFAEQLRQIGFTLNEAAAEIAGYLTSLEGDSARELELVHERRALLVSLVRKYAEDFEELLQYRATAQARLLELDSSDYVIEQLSARAAEQHEQVIALAEQITKIRKDAASRLATQVSRELESLAMAGASLVVSVRPAELSQHGADEVALELSAYPGAEPRPLGKGASGGELSRIMLALEVVLSQNSTAPTFIFDEVDAGVGGAAAIEVGRRLARLAQRAQVIVVTHLAQVAAFANNQLVVSKSVDDTFTVSSVRRVEGDSRLTELARMLSGLGESETGRQHALELLEEAKTLN